MLGHIAVCPFHLSFEESLLTNVSCVLEIFLSLVCTVNCNIFSKVKEMYLFYVNTVVSSCRLFHAMSSASGSILLCILNVSSVQERFKL